MSDIRCPECDLRLTGISYRTDFIFVAGVRHIQGGTWVTPCGHEIPNILEQQWDHDTATGKSTIYSPSGVPLMRWIEGG